MALPDSLCVCLCRLPCHLLEILGRINRVEAEYKRKFDSYPDETYIAKQLKTSAEKVRMIKQVHHSGPSLSPFVSFLTPSFHLDITWLHEAPAANMLEQVEAFWAEPETVAQNIVKKEMSLACILFYCPERLRD